MRKIKWENIIFIGVVALGLCGVVKHLQLNGFYGGVLTEVLWTLGVAAFFRYVVKDIRKNPKNWTI